MAKKPKHKNRSSIVTNSVRTLKMVPRKKKKLLKANKLLLSS